MYIANLTENIVFKYNFTEVLINSSSSTIRFKVQLLHYSYKYTLDYILCYLIYVGKCELRHMYRHATCIYFSWFLSTYVAILMQRFCTLAENQIRSLFTLRKWNLSLFDQDDQALELACLLRASQFFIQKKQKTKERKIHNSPVLIILWHSCNSHHELINNNYQSCEFSRWILWMDFDPPPTLKLRLHPFCVTTVLFARPIIRCKLKFSQSY